MLRNARVLVLFLLMAVAWSTTIRFPIRNLVEQAYRGESWEFFNNRVTRIDGQPKKPLEAYQRKCARAETSGLIFILGCGSFTLCYLNPRAKAYLVKAGLWLVPPATRKVQSPASSWRSWTVHATILTIVVGHLIAITFHHEFWPFSPYHMYSDHIQKEYSRNILYGITADGEVRVDQGKYWRPFNEARLTKTMEKLPQQSKLDQGSSAMLTTALDQFETNRQKGRPKTPPIHGVRLYRVTWQLDAAARLAEKRQRPGLTQLPPQGKKLLFEFRR